MPISGPTGNIFAGVSSVAKLGGAAITGAVTLSQGANITLTEVGNDIAIAAASVVQQTATVSLNDAAIRTLHTVGTVIVAGVPAKILVPLSFTFTVDVTAGAYTADAGDLIIGTATSFTNWLGMAGIDAALTDPGDVWFGYGVPANAPGSDNGFYNSKSFFTGQGLRVFKDGGTDPTGGNAANTLTVTVAYLTV